MNPITTRMTATNRSISGAAVTAGAGLLLMAVLGIAGPLVGLEGLVTPGNALRTAADIRASEGLFRFGIVSLLLVVALDVVVAWALYRVFSPVSRQLSLLAAWFRIVYAGVFVVAIGQLVGILRLLDDESHLQAFSAEQLRSQALLGWNAYGDIRNAGFLLFGLHLLVLGYLAYRSGYVPKLLGVLLSVAGFGYAFDSIAAVLSAGSWPALHQFMWIGELLLALWLVTRGRRLAGGESEIREDRAAAR